MIADKDEETETLSFHFPFALLCSHFCWHKDTYETHHKTYVIHIVTFKMLCESLIKVNIKQHIFTLAFLLHFLFSVSLFKIHIYICVCVCVCVYESITIFYNIHIYIYSTIREDMPYFKSLSVMCIDKSQ